MARTLIPHDQHEDYRERHRAQPGPATHHALTIDAPATTATSTTVADHGHRHRRRHHLQGEEAAAAWHSRLAAVWASAPAKVVLVVCVYFSFWGAGG